MTESPLRPHRFVPSGQRSFGNRICQCGSLEYDSVHRVDELDEEAKRVDLRRIGEPPD